MATVSLNEFVAQESEAAIKSDEPGSKPLSNYDQIVDAVAAAPISFLKLQTGNQKTISCVLVHDHDSHDRNAAYRLAKQLGDCNECARRFALMYNLTDVDGMPLVFSAEIVNSIAPECKGYDVFVAMKEMVAAATARPATGLKVLRSQKTLFGFPEHAGRMRIGGGNFRPYRHWFVPVADRDCTDAKIHEDELVRFERAIHRYIGQEHMDRVMAGAAAQGMASLKLLEKCLQGVTYGEKFLPSTRWLMRVLADLNAFGCAFGELTARQKLSVYAKHLLVSGLANDMNSMAVSFFIQTASNNIIGLLNDATGEAQMIAMCGERLSPSNYQRPSANAALTIGQIDESAKHLGEFVNSIMTIRELETRIPAVVTMRTSTPAPRGGGSGSSTAAYAAMRTSTPAPRGGGSGSSTAAYAAMRTEASKGKSPTFADRCGEDCMTQEIKALKTVADVVEFCRANLDAVLEIDAHSRKRSNAVAYIAKTTLSPDRLRHPHLGAFLNGVIDLTQYGMSGWMRVTHICPTYEYAGPNAVFVVRGAVASADMPNCCFAADLDSKYTRVCGSVYERVGQTTPITVPLGPIALGLGCSRCNEAGDLTGAGKQPISLRINQIPVEIAKMY